MHTLEIQLFSSLKDIVKSSSISQELDESKSTVKDLLEILYQRYPTLQEWDSQISIAVGVEYVKRNHTLQHGDVVSLLPPVQGG